MKRTDAWFKNQLVRVGAALAEADKRHSDKELEASRLALQLNEDFEWVKPMRDLTMKSNRRAG